MTAYKLISADSHIVEPADLYDTRIEPKFRSRAPRMERHRTRTGREYDALSDTSVAAARALAETHPSAASGDTTNSSATSPRHPAAAPRISKL